MTILLAVFWLIGYAVVGLGLLILISMIDQNLKKTIQGDFTTCLWFWPGPVFVALVTFTVRSLYYILQTINNSFRVIFNKFTSR